MRSLRLGWRLGEDMDGAGVYRALQVMSAELFADREGRTYMIIRVGAARPREIKIKIYAVFPRSYLFRPWH